SVPVFDKPLEISRGTDNRGFVYLEIARVNNNADRSGHRKRRARGKTVGDMNPFDFKVSKGNAVARLDRVQLRDVRQTVFLELVLEQRKRQVGAVHRYVDLP